MDTSTSSAGGGGSGGGANTGRMHDQSEAAPPAQGHRGRYREPPAAARFPTFPGLRVFAADSAGDPRGRPHVQEQLRFHAYGPDTAAALRGSAQAGADHGSRCRALQEVTSDLQIKTPQVNIVLDRDRAAALNVNWTNVSSALYDAFGPQFSSTIYAPTNQYRVLLEMLPEYQKHTDGLEPDLPEIEHRATGAADRGGQTRGERRAAEHPAFGPAALGDHFVRLRPGTSLGQATDEISEAAKDSLPATITGEFQGTAKVFQDSMQNMGILLIVAIAVVYIVLGVLYESYVHPLTILSGLPSAGFRRAAHAAAVQDRAEHLLVRGTDHADRHREEERHHADRFRAGSRAQGGTCRRRRPFTKAA